jgi:hypothetical protein
MSDVGYLVQYGRSAFVGRFTAAGEFARGDRVVARTPRGVEVGTVLCESGERFAATISEGAGGAVIRPATIDDDVLAAAREAESTALLAAADEAALPLAFLDAEIMLDGSAAILHALPCGPCDADPLFAELSARFGYPVRMLDLSRVPVVTDPPTGCGKPDCGEGHCTSCGTGGGCSSGSCSRGSVKSADDLTAYFAGLRASMEALGRTPLN